MAEFQCYYFRNTVPHPLLRASRFPQLRSTTAAHVKGIKSLFKRYNQALKALGENDLDIKYTRSRERQREGLLDPIDRAAHDAAFN